MDLHVDIDDRGLVQAFSRAPQSVSKAMEEGVMLAGEMVADYAKAHHRFIGRTGALDKVTEYCASELGWEHRCRIYERYRDFLEKEEAKRA